MHERDPVWALNDAMAFVSGDVTLPPEHLRDVFGRYIGITNAEEAAAFAARLEEPEFAGRIKEAADRVHPVITGNMPLAQVVGHIKTLMRRAFADFAGITQQNLL
jgi:hypothetical protein